MNLQKLADECNIFDSSDEDLVINHINNLFEHFSNEDLAIIYGYFIQNVENIKILTHLIKCLDRIRYSASLDTLLDIAILRGKFLDLNSKYENFLNVRIVAIKAIANLKDTKAVVYLLDCMNDKKENYKIRLNCADALGKIGDKYAVAPLMELVGDESEKSVYIRESAATALGMLGDMRAIESLVSILETKKGLMDKFTFLKERAIEALGKFNFSNERVFKALRNSLTDECAQIRINSIEALMNSNDERAIPLIKKMLNDDDEEVVKNATIALYNLLDSDILYEILREDSYSECAKREAQVLVDEYETDGAEYEE